MISKDKFQRFVKEMISQDGEKLKKDHNHSITVAGLVLLAIGFFTVMTKIGIVLIIVGFVFLVASSDSINRIKESRRKYRDKHIDKILDCLLEGYNYKFESNGEISPRIFEDSQFVNKFDIYKGSDKLSINIPNDDGSASSTYLTMCDLDVYTIDFERKYIDPESNLKDEWKELYENKDFKRTGYDYIEKENNKYVYNGVFGYVEFPFDFKCVLSLNCKYMKRGTKLEVVRLEGVDFHKKIGVYSSDQIEARYILTPDVMEKLLKLCDAYSEMRMVLVDNKMYFCFPNSDLFELRKSRDENGTLFDSIYDDISNLLLIVEEIKNNNKTFKM